jgi:hypothetical protein
MLEVFENVKIENKNRIENEDKQFCEKFNLIYTETLECYKNILDSLISLYNKQIVTVNNTYDIDVSIYGDFGINEAIKSIVKLNENFIHKICYHFSQKYTISIDVDKICDKYKHIEMPYHSKENKDKTLKLNLIEYVYIDYNMILDEIFLQLNGLNFLEKAVDEIKQKAKMPLRWYSYRNHWNYEVKGKTIKFKVNIKHVYPVLYYYDNNETTLIDYFTHNKIDDYTSYDNGNTNIKFYNSADALEFAKRYLGYIEMTEEEKEIYKNKF